MAIYESLDIVTSAICYVFVDDGQLAEIILVLSFCYFIKSMVKKSMVESFVIDIGQTYGDDLRKSSHFRFGYLM